MQLHKNQPMNPTRKNEAALSKEFLATQQKKISIFSETDFYASILTDTWMRSVLIIRRALENCETVKMTHSYCCMTLPRYGPKVFARFVSKYNHIKWNGNDSLFCTYQRLQKREDQATNARSSIYNATSVQINLNKYHNSVIISIGMFITPNVHRIYYRFIMD